MKTESLTRPLIRILNQRYLLVSQLIVWDDCYGLASQLRSRPYLTLCERGGFKVELLNKIRRDSQRLAEDGSMQEIFVQLKRHTSGVAFGRPRHQLLWFENVTSLQATVKTRLIMRCLPLAYLFCSPDHLVVQIHSSVLVLFAQSSWPFLPFISLR